MHDIQIADFRTDRLWVRDWTPMLDSDRLRRDLRAVLTPAVLQTLPEPLHLHDDDIAGWIKAQSREGTVFTLHDTGHDTPGDTLLGLMLLAIPPGPDPAIHVGYLLAEPVWGQGYATELLRGLVATLKNHNGARLVGGVGIDNPASARVLQKAGFLRDAALSSPDTDFFVQTIAQPTGG